MYFNIQKRSTIKATFLLITMKIAINNLSEIDFNCQEGLLNEESEQHKGSHWDII